MSIYSDLIADNTALKDRMDKLTDLLADRHIDIEETKLSKIADAFAAFEKVNAQEVTDSSTHIPTNRLYISSTGDHKLGSSYAYNISFNQYGTPSEVEKVRGYGTTDILCKGKKLTTTGAGNLVMSISNDTTWDISSFLPEALKSNAFTIYANESYYVLHNASTNTLYISSEHIKWYEIPLMYGKENVYVDTRGMIYNWNNGTGHILTYHIEGETYVGRSLYHPDLYQSYKNSGTADTENALTFIESDTCTYIKSSKYTKMLKVGSEKPILKMAEGIFEFYEPQVKIENLGFQPEKAFITITDENDQYIGSYMISNKNDIGSGDRATSFVLSESQVNFNKLSAETTSVVNNGYISEDSVVLSLPIQVGTIEYLIFGQVE